MRRVARLKVASVKLRIENPEFATGIQATRIAALVGITTCDGLDDLALAAGTFDALSWILFALSAVGALRRTAEEHDNH